MARSNSNSKSNSNGTGSNSGSGQNSEPSYARRNTYKRALRKHLARYFYALMIVGLNVSTIMLLIGRLSRQQPVSFQSELMMFAFLLFMDLWILPICVLELDYLEPGPDFLRLGNILWSSRVLWADIVSLKMSDRLVWAILRTKRAFYLINRRDIPRFEELIVEIGEKIEPSAIIVD